MRNVFSYYRELRFEGRPIIDIGNTNKTGLGIQAFYSKGVDFKPLPRHKHVELYGEPGYKTFHGNKTWPDFKHWSIYKWKRDETGAISTGGRFYCYHDCTESQSCISSIFLDLAAGPGVVVGGSCSVADAIHAVLQPVVEKKGFRFDLVEDPEVRVELDEKVESPKASTSAAAAAKAQVHTDQGEAGQASKEVINIASSASNEGSDTLTLDNVEELSEGEIREEEEPPPLPAKKVKQAIIKPVGHPVYDCKWDWDQDRRNPYERYPFWGKHCQVCGIGKHAAKNWQGDTTCPLLKEKGWIGCAYRRCREPGHRTIVCRALHQICPLCLHRGHDRYAGCASWSPLQWAVARGDFEDCAPEGLYTVSRQHDERWGFWAPKWGTPYPYPLTYRDLMALDVAAADRALHAQRVGVAISAGGPRPPSPPPGVPGGSVGRPVMARLGPPVHKTPGKGSQGRSTSGARPSGGAAGSAASGTKRDSRGKTTKDSSGARKGDSRSTTATRSRSASASASAGPSGATRSRRRSPEVKYLGRGSRGGSRGRK